MRLLILTQKIDTEDSILGFFHAWVIEFAKRCEHVSVICLERGAYRLPRNVDVFSLGKESGRSKIKYIKNFFSLVWGLHDRYDYVLVHMNQEYVLLGGLLWKIMGKKVFLWRNHPKGNFLTDIAIKLSKKIFYTSLQSYTAKFSHAKQMGVGIDVSQYAHIYSDRDLSTMNKKILFLSRMAPIKRPDLLIEALALLHAEGEMFEANFYGDPLPKDEAYYRTLLDRVRALSLENKIHFFPAIPHYSTPSLFGAHDISVNLTETGSFDKTILESGICGSIPLTTNISLESELSHEMIIGSDTPRMIAATIKKWLHISPDQLVTSRKTIHDCILEKHSLSALIDTLCTEISA